MNKKLISEVILPQRPPAPPTDYFQMNLGGYDAYSLHLAPRANELPQGGYVGCVRGFKIADQVVDLPKKAQQNIDQGKIKVIKFLGKMFLMILLNWTKVNKEAFLFCAILVYPIHLNGEVNIKNLLSYSIDLIGVLPECNMKCDAEPCKNGGICTEDFTNQESSCDCELTSYFGENCMEEKGADFNGESILQRKFVLNVPITMVI